MRTKETTVAVLTERLPEDMPEATAAHIATIVSLTADGTPLVRLDASHPDVPARMAVRATRDRIETAIVLCQQAVVLFENGDRSRPLIVGLIEVVEPQPQEPQSPGPAAAGVVTTAPGDRSGAAPFIEADVDGKRVRVTAQDEIVLQCGSASVTLRRNGRVVIRGTYVETHSEGTNRIKGGQVQIN